MELKVSAILLAAGFSSRMNGRDKLLLPYKGRPLLEWAVALLESLPCQEKILVATQARLAQTPIPSGVLAVANAHPEIGQSESLRLGVNAAGGDGYFFLNADQPRLTLAALSPMLDLIRANAGKIIYPVVGGHPCTPVFFPSRFRDELLMQTGDAGGRAVRAAHPEACLPWKASPPTAFADIDSQEDYAALRDDL